MTLLIRRLAVLGVVAVVAVLACTEDLTAPGRCDDFCPPEKIVMHDTILDTAITRDSAYGRPIGYINPPGAPVMLAETLPGLRTSRALFRFNPVALLRRVIAPPDTTTGPLLQPDSVFVALRIVRREAKATNLTLHVYRLPLTIDSTTTFSDPAVSDSFATALLRSVNLDTLLARPKIKDSLIAIDSVHFDPTTGDRIAVDTTTGQVQYRLILKFDSLAVPFDTTDSGRVALGVRVTADSFASISLSASEQLNGQPPTILWFNRFDSLGTIVSFRQAPRSTGGPGAFGAAQHGRPRRLRRFYRHARTHPTRLQPPGRGAAGRAQPAAAQRAAQHPRFDPDRPGDAHPHPFGLDSRRPVRFLQSPRAPCGGGLRRQVIEPRRSHAAAG